MNKPNMKIAALTFCTLFLAGCVVPGQHLSVESAVINQTDLDESVSNIDVYALTPKLVRELAPAAINGQSNPSLDSELANYEYFVGPADILNVTIWDHPELTIPAGSYRSATESGNWVHADGSIFYPYIGLVDVAGKTVVQIRKEMATRLSQYIETPQVDVNVANFRSQKAYITGEVSKPGKQPISNVPLTLLDAINQAGGLATNADWRNVVLTRDGKEERVSLYGLMQKGDLTQNRLLRDGDIVHVPRNDGQKVFVMGEVNEPKIVKIDRAGMSLTEALTAAGGLNQLSSDATGVFVIRASKDNEVIANVYQLNVENPTAMIIGTEFDIQPYDIVYVTAAPITRWNRVMGQLLPTIKGFNDLTEGALRIRNW
ncbi:polysaccharide export protein [Shewanella abyssi]|uniref:polysaccharide export protein n=1 Tax=Shewanella abyssi TaxID=311789 RepID=UPI00200C6E24|nr:polysaccharide export protein [Shewanella abyssi]MCL1049576.1 polysaccharide export protein [Shewanella abyssi]